MGFWGSQNWYPQKWRELGGRRGFSGRVGEKPRIRHGPGMDPERQVKGLKVNSRVGGTGRYWIVQQLSSLHVLKTN